MPKIKRIIVIDIEPDDVVEIRFPHGLVLKSDAEEGTTLGVIGHEHLPGYSVKPKSATGSIDFARL